MEKVLKIFTAVLLCFAIAAGFSISAKEVTIGSLKYKVNTTDKIARCTGLAKEATKAYNLVIPSTVKYNNVTLKVISVEPEAFVGDDYLKKVTLSDYTEAIGSYAFYRCDNMSVESLGKSLKKIGSHAFYQTGVNGTFTKIVFPSTMETVGEYAFAYCDALTTVSMNSGLLSIGERAFTCCNGLKSVVFPGSLNTIGTNAFTGCEALNEVYFMSGNGRTEIGVKCFDNVKSLTTVTFDGSGVEKIDDSAFIGCNIGLLSLPSSLRIIGSGSFAGNNLYMLYIPEGVQIIESAAFMNQTDKKMTGLTIPSTVTSIEMNAFNWVGYLEYVSCEATTPPAAGEDAFNAYTRSTANLIVPESAVGAYRNAPVWKDFRYINGVDYASVDDIIADQNTEEIWYDLMGNKVNPDNVTPGIYIVSRNGKTEKVIIR